MEYSKVKSIVMIATEKPSILHINKTTGKIAFEMLLARDNNQHIYVIEDIEFKSSIKDGDYVYWKNGDFEGIEQIKNGAYPKTIILKKVIASTDLELNVPLIKDDFLVDFILEYNNKNFIDKVNIELEWNMVTLATKEVVPRDLIPKIINNTVNISIPKVTKYYVNEFLDHGLETIIRIKKDNSNQMLKIHEFYNLEQAVEAIKKDDINNKEIILYL